MIICVYYLLNGLIHLLFKALATGDCKLGTQFITAQNMASHYKRVINAKGELFFLNYIIRLYHIIYSKFFVASIDITPPKSLIQSQKGNFKSLRYKD
jgi:hypothetical protein